MLFRSLCFIFLFSIATTLNAHVGILSYVIEAANRNETPGYIRTLMEEVSGKLQLIARERKLDTPHKKLAWLFTMHAIVWRSYWGTADGFLETCGSEEFINLKGWHNAALTLIFPSIHRQNLADQAHRVARLACHEASNAVKKSRYFHFKRTGTVADQRVAEWEGLNWLLTNLEEVVTPVYEATVEQPLDPKNPFYSTEETVRFFELAYGKMREEEMVFLAPWLVHVFSPSQVPEKFHRLFATMDPDWGNPAQKTMIFPNEKLSEFFHQLGLNQ